MEESATFGLYGWMAIGAAIGVGTAIKRRKHAPDHPGFRLIVLAVAMAAIMGEAHTWRGFVLVLTATIGAYKVAQVLAEPVVLYLRGGPDSG